MEEDKAGGREQCFLESQPFVVYHPPSFFSSWSILKLISDIDRFTLVYFGMHPLTCTLSYRIPFVVVVVVVQSLKSCPTLCNPMDCSTPGFSVLHYLPEFSQTHVHWVSDAIYPSHPLSSPSPPALNLSHHQGLFQWVDSLHQVAKVLEFQLQHQSFNEHPGLISFRMDRLDLLAVQGTLKSLPQHHSSKASILQHSAFFTAQLSHSYTTTEKTIALTRQTFVDKVKSLLFNMLSRLDPHQQIPFISAGKLCLSVHNQWRRQLGIERQQTSLFLMTFKGELGPARYANETKREGGGKIGADSFPKFGLPFICLPATLPSNPEV